MSAPVILPPARLGILGGGQLGRMFVQAARTMGYTVTVLDPDPDAPAAEFANLHLCAAFDDAEALRQLADSCAAITTEFENVNAESMRWLAQHTVVSPRGECVAVAQDRIREKTFFQQHGLPVAPFLPVTQADDLDRDLSDYLPGILKTARLGYDGKGQQRVRTAEEARAAWQPLGVPCVLEKMLPLQLEISAIVTRAADGQMAVFPIAENQHHQGILDVTLVPARVSTDLAQAAQQAACRVAEALDYVGVLAVEFFVLEDGQLRVNEMAPRPHNSGHYTLDATVSSQFQQQVRAMCGLPPAATDLLRPVAMLNLLGDVWPGAGTDACREPDWQPLQAEAQGFLHLYGKREARIGRKMAHYNLLAEQATTAAAQVAILRDGLLQAAGRTRSA